MKFHGTISISRIARVINLIMIFTSPNLPLIPKSGNLLLQPVYEGQVAVSGLGVLEEQAVQFLPEDWSVDIIVKIVKIYRVGRIGQD